MNPDPHHSLKEMNVISVTDTGCLFHPGSASSILTQKIVSKLWEILRGLFFPDPDPDFLPIPDPGVKKAPGPGSVMLNEMCLAGE